MPVREVLRRGKRVLVVDVVKRTIDGQQERYRYDAQVQTKTGARDEEHRVIAYFQQHGHLPRRSKSGQLEGAGSDKTPKTPPTLQEISKTYRESVMAATLKPSTQISYGEILDKVLMPRLGSMLVTQVEHMTFIELEKQLVQAKASASRRRNIHGVLRRLLRHAVDLNVLAALPKMPPLPKAEHKERSSIPSSKDVERLLEVASPSLRLAVALAAYAGLRSGEVRGLRWGDVQLAKKQIVVRRAVYRQREATPKSGHERKLPIVWKLHMLLAAEGRQPSNRHVALTVHGKAWGDMGLLQALQRACKRAGVSKHRFHDLRHFFVTDLLRRGCPANHVQRLAGHSELTTTQRYAHTSEDDLRRAMALFDLPEQSLPASGADKASTDPKPSDSKPT